MGCNHTDPRTIWNDTTVAGSAKADFTGRTGQRGRKLGYSQETGRRSFTGNAERFDKTTAKP